MKEIQFLHKNIKKWKAYELLLQKNQKEDPDRLYELYIELTDDLAFAKSYFPKGESFQYLNQLTQKIHGIIYQNKPINSKRIVTFWKEEFPLLFHSIKKEFYISLLIFSISILIGILSTTYDPTFVNAILGDKYVNMTLDNIHSGDPMAVYKQMNGTSMFLGITVNNIRVAFFALVLGVFTSLGTGYIMFSNGVMLGTFHTFLAQQGIIKEAFATIWIHGTFEIFSIVVAGAAGIVIGNSFIFPGTHSRSHAFKISTFKGAKIAIGLVPFFIVAGFLEGYITRHTMLPYALRFSMIAFFFTIIIFYFFIYPPLLIKKTTHEREHFKF